MSSLLWDYFVKGEGDKAKCNRCEVDLKTTTRNTSSLRKHLKSRHPEEYTKVIKAEEDRKREKESSKRKSVDSEVPNSVGCSKQVKLSDLNKNFSLPDKQKQFDEAMTDFFADTFVSFNVASQDSFK